MTDHGLQARADEIVSNIQRSRAALAGGALIDFTPLEAQVTDFFDVVADDEVRLENVDKDQLHRTLQVILAGLELLEGDVTRQQEKLVVAEA
jgi:hypothetical protein